MSILFGDMPTPGPGNNWTNTSTFNCVGINRLPLHGMEILIIGLIYVMLISMYAVTFIDVAIKQMWPEKFLDPEVLKRVKKLQKQFPGILAGSGPGGALTKVSNAEEEVEEEGEEAPLKVNEVLATNAQGEEVTVKYDAIVSQQPYIATCCVDEDLVFVLANNDSFGSVSSYCTCTVRGYAMLSTMLLIIGMTMIFLWTHNAMIDPIRDNVMRYVQLIGYALITFTGIVMCGPDNRAVHRLRNLMLWDSIKTSSPLLALHGIGFGGFLVVPWVANVWQIIFQPVAGNHLPNRNAMIAGSFWQAIGLLTFTLPPLLYNWKIIKTRALANQLSILGESFLFTVSTILFVQIESYSTAACGQMVNTFDACLGGCMALVWVTLCVKQYAGAPVGPFTNGPSGMLTNFGTPVASTGPVPVLNYDKEAAILPIVQPAQ